jgi:RimJ/RimL family protein N-acetyltransferase
MLNPSPLIQFEAPRLLITRLEIALKEHVEALNDREHMQFSEQRHLQHTMLTEQAYIQNVRGLLLGIWLKDNSVPVGTLYAEIDRRNLTADLGIMILPGHKHRGYGGEAWGATLDYLLDPLRGGMEKVEAGTMEENFPMRHICVAAGMLYEGTRSSHFILNGRRCGLVMFGKVR